MKIKRTLSVLLVTLLASATMPLHIMAATLPFKDVAAGSWYYNDVKTAYETGLVNGRDFDRYEPEGNLTYAEAIKLAACMHQTHTGAEPIEAVSGYDWYLPYVDYCRAERIIYQDYDWNANATREVYMDIFSRALPASALKEINDVDYGEVPDVPVTHRYAYSIYLLYRAGIVQGMDAKLTCKPKTNVTRAEVATILTRMMDETKRIKIDLPDDDKTPEGGDVVVQNPTETQRPDKDGPQVLELPWEKEGAKHPDDYTLADFEKLSNAQRAVFIEIYPNHPAYEAWLDKNGLTKPETDKPVTDKPETNKPETNKPDTDKPETNKPETDKPTETDKPAETDKPEGKWPWEKNGAKAVEDYTLAEYHKLTDEEKAAFPNAFQSAEGYDNWRVQVGIMPPPETEAPDPSVPDIETESPDEERNPGSTVTEMPWDEPGAKPHSEYTLDDYNKLTDAQKELFLAFFETPEEMDAWLDRYGMKEPETEPPKIDHVIDPDGYDIPGLMPWDKAGGKPVEEYTWSDYQKLTEFQKEVFPDAFVDPEAYDAWLAANAK